MPSAAASSGPTPKRRSARLAAQPTSWGGAELSEPKEGSAANEGVANETTDAGEQVTRPTSSGETRLP